MEKICVQCAVSKDLSDFPSYKLVNRVGYRNECKICTKKYKRERYDINKPAILIAQKIYITNNYEIIRQRDNNYKKCNKSKISEKQKKYYKDNIIKIRKRSNEYEKNRKIIDPLYKLTRVLMNNIRKSFKRNGLSKPCKTNKIIGCSYTEFKIYLESKWEIWMNWDNHGLYNGQLNFGWDIDHIIPIKTAMTEDNIINLCHYTNLQPLCSYINRVVKRDYIPK